MTDTTIAPGDSLIFRIMSGWAQPDQVGDDTFNICLYLYHLPHYNDTVASNDSVCFTTVFKGNNSTSLKQKYGSHKVEVHPNPSNGILHIKSERIMERIEVMDLMGRTLISTRPEQYKGLVDLSGLPASVYILTITGPEGRKIVRKIQKL